MKLADVVIGAEYQAGDPKHWPDEPRRVRAEALEKRSVMDTQRRVRVTNLDWQTGEPLASHSYGQHWQARDLIPWAEWLEGYLPRLAAREARQGTAARLEEAFKAGGIGDLIEAAGWRTESRYEPQASEGGFPRRTGSRRVLMLRVPEGKIATLTERVLRLADYEHGQPL